MYCNGSVIGLKLPENGVNKGTKRVGTGTDMSVKKSSVSLLQETWYIDKAVTLVLWA
jgi:hypothetical protein